MMNRKLQDAFLKDGVTGLGFFVFEEILAGYEGKLWSLLWVLLPAADVNRLGIPHE